MHACVHDWNAKLKCEADHMLAAYVLVALAVCQDSIWLHAACCMLPCDLYHHHSLMSHVA